MIVQNASSSGEKTTDLSFTITKDDLAKTSSILEPISREIKAGALTHQQDVAKLSVVGIGMKSHSGVAANMFDSLGSSGVNIHMISTSEIKISVLIDAKDAEKGSKAIHDRFKLGE
jgi:aspartate kinase